MAPRYLAFAASAGLAIAWAFVPLKHAAVEPRVDLSPTRLLADGHDVATLTIVSEVPPTVSVQGNPHTALLGPLEHSGAVWTAEIHSGVLPGGVRIHVRTPGSAPIDLALSTVLAERDSHDDGTPDFLRLDSPSARAAFRRWFTYLAEAQYFQPPENRPGEISDCAALIRYAYRESLRVHDGAWATAARLPLVPAFDSPRKYEYPYTALGANLFRVTPGPFRPADLESGAFAQFADAKTLWRFNTHLVSRELTTASTGDILFYRQLHSESPETFHSMIFLGKSQIHPDAASYVLYHTGPQAGGPGEIRRLTLDELQRFPEPEWRPDAGNPRFLGVYRWNILRNAQVNP